MTDDPKYPQYRVEVTWEEDGESFYDSERWTTDEPGRRKNSTGRDLMFKEDPGEDEVRRETLEEWWPKYIELEPRTNRPKTSTLNPSAPEIIVKRMPDESWILSWFEHWTFDVGQTDQEACASFDRFVARYERYQDHHYIKELGDGYRCLMGAEDRWRWHGSADPNGERTSAPCRCEHCKAQGKIRIGH